MGRRKVFVVGCFGGRAARVDGVPSVPRRVDGVGAVQCRVTRVAAAEARERRSSPGVTLSIRTRPRARPGGTMALEPFIEPVPS